MRTASSSDSSAILVRRWFQLGDSDLGTHLLRSNRLQKGDSLSAITRDFCHAWGIEHRIIPMTDDPMPTIVDTVEMGELPFQEYFVHQRCKPTVKGFRFEGAESARPAEGVEEAFNEADAVVICPSNPWVSIDPILRVTKLKPTRVSSPASKRKLIVAISPIIGGKAVKGPAAKMYRELGIMPSALAVAKHYGELLDGFVFDQKDAGLENEINNLGIKTLICDTLMKDEKGRRRVAKDVLEFIDTLL
ncbi:MAG TPA: 2-phospho-L-lactate transferase [Anaerolineales bacterium]|nr:2-phospho-L-lactate transferase [Anaerolineales bacterium]